MKYFAVISLEVPNQSSKEVLNTSLDMTVDEILELELPGDREVRQSSGTDELLIKKKKSLWTGAAGGNLPV